MRIIFMGTPVFAVPTLEALLESSHEVALVVTQPDRPAGRSGSPRPPAVKRVAERAGIEVYQPEKLGEDAVEERLRSAQPEVIVVVAYGKILPANILSLPPYGCVNVHASLLPAYRGAAPINWALVRGETKTGVTIMQMDEGMDTGPIIARKSVPILEDDDAESLGHLLSVEGAQQLVKVLDDAQANGGFGKLEAQDESQASYAPLLKKSDGLIDWSADMEDVILHVRGMAPWPSAYTKCSRGSFKILKIEPAWEALYETSGDAMRSEPGQVVALAKGYGPVVRTSDGFVLITRGQVQGKRAMDGPDLVNGQILKKNEVLG